MGARRGVALRFVFCGGGVTLFTEPTLTVKHGKLSAAMRFSFLKCREVSAAQAFPTLYLRQMAAERERIFLAIFKSQTSSSHSLKVCLRTVLQSERVACSRVRCEVCQTRSSLEVHISKPRDLRHTNLGMEVRFPQTNINYLLSRTVINLCDYA